LILHLLIEVVHLTRVFFPYPTPAPWRTHTL
jgi:hypothetical protein